MSQQNINRLADAIIYVGTPSADLEKMYSLTPDMMRKPWPVLIKQKK